MTIDFGFLAAPATAPGVRSEIYAGLLDSCSFHHKLGYRTAWRSSTTSATTTLARRRRCTWRISRRDSLISPSGRVLVTPWYEPLRLAGELAMLSNMAEQKLYVGLEDAIRRNTSTTPLTST